MTLLLRSNYNFPFRVGDKVRSDDGCTTTITKIDKFMGKTRVWGFWSDTPNYELWSNPEDLRLIYDGI